MMFLAASCSCWKTYFVARIVRVARGIQKVMGLGYCVLALHKRPCWAMVGAKVFPVVEENSAGEVFSECCTCLCFGEWGGGTLFKK